MKRFSTYLLLAICAALGWTSCGDVEGPSDLRWEISFKCTSDAAQSRTLRVRVLEDACLGTAALYDTTIASGQSGMPVLLSPGDYYLEVTALDASQTAVAFYCEEKSFPIKSLSIAMTNPRCDREIEASMDGGLPLMRADAGEEDAEVIVPLADAGCPEGGCADGCQVDPGDCACSQYEGHSYLVCPGALNWNEARKKCRQRSTDLTIINSAEENAYVTSLLGGTTRWMGANDRGDNGTVIGLGDCSAPCRKAGQEGKWTWVDTAGGKPRGPSLCEVNGDGTACPSGSGMYTAWAAGNPNNEIKALCYPSQDCPEREDCGAIGADGTWQDLACGNSLPFVCETP